MSIHGAILGESGTGKSRFVKEVLLPHYGRLGRPVVVLDPVGQRWEHGPHRAAWVTKDPMLFAKHMRTMRGCVCVIDEMRRWCSQHKWMMALSYFSLEARNDGHLSYFAGQRLVHLPPDFREQCGTFVCFAQKRKGAELLADEVDDCLMETARLPKGTFIKYKSMETPTKTVLFDPVTMRSVCNRIA